MRGGFAVPQLIETHQQQTAQFLVLEGLVQKQGQQDIGLAIEAQYAVAQILNGAALLPGKTSTPVPRLPQDCGQASPRQHPVDHLRSNTLCFNHGQGSKQSPGASGNPDKNSYALIFFPPAFCTVSNTSVPLPHATAIPSRPAARISLSLFPPVPPASSATVAHQILTRAPFTRL